MKPILDRLKLFLVKNPEETIFLAKHKAVLEKTFKLFYKKRSPTQVPLSATVRKIYLKKAALYVDLKAKNTPFFLIKKKIKKITKKFERIMLNYQAAVTAATKEPYIYPFSLQKINQNSEKIFVKKNTKFLLFFGKKFLKRKVISFLTKLKTHLEKKKSKVKRPVDEKKQKNKTFLQNVLNNRNYIPQIYEH